MENKHLSVRRLYTAAAEQGDPSPAAVARRLNVSAQTLNNWETRGISQDGVLKAQECYGVDANWLLAGEDAVPKMVLSTESHSARLDPEIVALAHRAVCLLMKEKGGSYNIEADPAPFVHMYAVHDALKTPQGAEKDGSSNALQDDGARKTGASRVVRS